MDLKGMISPVITPFKGDDAVDYGLFEQHVDRLLEAGMHGVSPGGSTGEGATLDDAELGQLVEISRRRAGSKPVVCGVMRNSTAAALRTAKVARDAGADALMVTPTFYNVLVPNDDGNLDFYWRIAEEVDLPVIIYNVVPQNTISPELFQRMRQEIPNLAGIKQSVGGIQSLYAMRLAAEDALVYAATDEMLYSCFTLGADGAISAVLALFPELSVKLWDLHATRADAEAMRIQAGIHDVWMRVTGPQFTSRIKEAMRLLDIESGHSRSPSTPVDSATRQHLHEAIARSIRHSQP